MTNPTRTRAEIQADEAAEIDQQIQALTEKRKALSACWISGYRLPDTEYGRRRVEIQMSGGDVVRPLLDDSVVCIPAADLIPREEHERAVAEARKMKNQDWSDAATVAALSHKLDANTALKYLVKEYDLDTSYMDTARPRTYPFDHNGHVYEVVVRRKGEAVEKAQAVAPKGVVKELRAIARKYAIAFMDWNPNDKASHEQLQCADKDLNAALARITELPEPIAIEIGIAEVTKIRMDQNSLPDAEKPTLKGIAAALLESAKDGDHE